MSESFNIEIVSPEKKILTEKVDSANLPGFEGDMTILSDHIPIITFLRPGIITVIGKKELKYFVGEGTIEFSNNNLSILSSTIIELSALSSEKISKMTEECKTQLDKADLDDKLRYIFSNKLDCLNKINL